MLASRERLARDSPRLRRSIRASCRPPATRSYDSPGDASPPALSRSASRLAWSLLLRLRQLVRWEPASRPVRRVGDLFVRLGHRCRPLCRDRLLNPFLQGLRGSRLEKTGPGLPPPGPRPTSDRLPPLALPFRQSQPPAGPARLRLVQARGLGLVGSPSRAPSRTTVGASSRNSKAWKLGGRVERDRVRAIPAAARSEAVRHGGLAVDDHVHQTVPDAERQLVRMVRARSGEAWPPRRGRRGCRSPGR